MRTKERLEVGYRLNGRYRVCRSLGQGGFGITYLAEFASNICKDAGYGAIASQLEIFAKLAILALSMPILFAFIQTIGEFL